VNYWISAKSLVVRRSGSAADELLKKKFSKVTDGGFTPSFTLGYTSIGAAEQA
jgi:hypothetical protein